MNMSLLLTALIAVESGGDIHAVGDKGQAVGCLQIHPGVITDVNAYTDGIVFSLDDRLHEHESRLIATRYLIHYLIALRKKTGEVASYEAAARIWNGGYHGYRFHRERTDRYWEKVRAELVDMGVELGEAD